MICVSIAERDFGRCREALLSCELAELRIDKTDFSEEEIKELFALPGDIIATCRPGTKSERQREALLCTAISSGAAYVDIEIVAAADYLQRISDKAKKHGTKLIVSYHNERHTPEVADLEDIISQCFRMKADLAKIVCRVHSSVDSARILSLYQKNENIIAFGLGEQGTFTRVASLFLGAPFTYAAWAPGEETADGQLDKQRLKIILDALR